MPLNSRMLPTTVPATGPSVVNAIGAPVAAGAGAKAAAQAAAAPNKPARLQLNKALDDLPVPLIVFLHIKVCIRSLLCYGVSRVRRTKYHNVSGLRRPKPW